MKPSDREKFLEIVVGFAELKGKQLSAPALELYWNAMQAWSIEDFNAAAAHLISTCKFMPTPADFHQLRKAGRMTAGEAWAMAKSSWWTGNRNVVTGEYSGSSSGDDLVDLTVRMIGGYTVLARSTDEQLGFLERRFCEHYEALEDRVEAREAVPQIALQTLVKRLRQRS